MGAKSEATVSLQVHEREAFQYWLSKGTWLFYDRLYKPNVDLDAFLNECSNEESREIIKNAWIEAAKDERNPNEFNIKFANLLQQNLTERFGGGSFKRTVFTAYPHYDAGHKRVVDWEKILQYLHADQGLRFVDFSKVKRPSAEILARIPQHITGVKFNKTEGILSKKEIIAWLSYLPPHIKSAELPTLMLERGLCFTHNDYYRAFEARLPPTLEMINDEMRGAFKPPTFPASYSQVFNPKGNTRGAIKDAIVELLKHYLGTDQSSQESFLTHLRCINRVHAPQVRELLKKIEDDEIVKPLQILFELKRINEVNHNPHGGLQMRIHFISNYLSNPPVTDTLSLDEDEDENTALTPQ